MDSKTNTKVSIDAQMTPEMIEKFKKFIEQQERKNAYNREYMKKVREDKERTNKIQREYRHRKKEREKLAATTN